MEIMLTDSFYRFEFIYFHQTNTAVVTKYNTYTNIWLIYQAESKSFLPY